MRSYSIILGGIYSCLGFAEILNWIREFSGALPADIFSGVALLIVGLVFLRVSRDEYFEYGGAVLSGVFLALFVILAIANLLGALVSGEPWNYIADFKAVLPWVCALPIIFIAEKQNI